MFLLFFVLATIRTQIYDPIEYLPGPNLIANPHFSSPDIGGIVFQNFAGGISGWSCPNAQIVTISALCAVTSNVCTHKNVQAIDLDISFVYEIYSQGIEISSTNQYLLSIFWL